MANAVIEAAVDLLKKELAKKVMAQLVAKSAFFANVFVNPIIGFFLPVIIDALWSQGALGINWVWIIVENNRELKNAIESRENLAHLLASSQDTTKAEERFDEDADDLIKRNHDHLPR